MIDWPRLLDFAARHPGAAFALVTLVGREGSSYRPPGARMLVAACGDFAGSVSGGCLEDELSSAAGGVIARGVPVFHTIDTRLHYGCHGRLGFFIERVEPGFLDQVATAIHARRVFRLRTVFRESADAVQELGTTLQLEAEEQDVAVEDGVFVQRVGLRPRLWVVSSLADAEPLLQMAYLLGWEAGRILPVGASPAQAEAAPGCSLTRVCAAEEFTRFFPPDEWTAVVIMTHHLARDANYLCHVLPAPYGYVGLLGSRRRRDAALAELGERGLLDDEAIGARLHAPVGLDIGATDPAAIALSIVAEIQAHWAGRGAGALRERHAPIYNRP